MEGLDSLVRLLDYADVSVEGSDKGGYLLLMAICVALIVYTLIRDARHGSWTGDPDFDERQRQIRLKGAWVAMWTLHLYLFVWAMLYYLQPADWVNHVALMACGALLLSSLVFYGYCLLRGATRDADRRKFPFQAVVSAAVSCIWAASRWTYCTHRRKIWPMYVEIYGAEKAGPCPPLADEFTCLVTAVAAGMAVLAVIALACWLRERRRKTEES